MWVKIDDGMATHPKLLKAGPLALAIQIRAICYASHNLTDGILTHEAIPLLLTGLQQYGIDLAGNDMMSTGCQADELDWPSIMVESGLWDTHPQGYCIHDYLQWNVSKKEHEAWKKKLSRSGKKGMKSRWNKGNSHITEVITDVITDHITSTSTSTSTLHSLNSSSPKKGKRSISEEDKPTDKHFEFGKKLGVHVGPEWGKFYNYCKAHDKRYADFEAAFRNWIANSHKMNGGRHDLR